MRPAAEIVAQIEASGIPAALQFLPGDIRTTPVYTLPLTRESTPDAFMRTDVDIPWPSVFVNNGRGPVPHPDAYKMGEVTQLVAIYPTVNIYVPNLAGIDAEGVIVAVKALALPLLDHHTYPDPDTGIGSRLLWTGDLGPRAAVEYPNTMFDQMGFRAQTRTTVED